MSSVRQSTQLRTDFGQTEKPHYTVPYRCWQNPITNITNIRFMYVHKRILFLYFRESNTLVITPTRGYGFNNDDEAIMTDIEHLFTNHEYQNNKEMDEAWQDAGTILLLRKRVGVNVEKQDKEWILIGKKGGFFFR